MEGKESNQN